MQLLFLLLLLQLVITALKCHKYDKNIQVTGSAALFYLTNSEYRLQQSTRLRQKVVQVVLNGMESYQEVTVRVLNPPSPPPHFWVTKRPTFDHVTRRKSET